MASTLRALSSWASRAGSSASPTRAPSLLDIAILWVGQETGPDGLAWAGAFVRAHGDERIGTGGRPGRTKWMECSAAGLSKGMGGRSWVAMEGRRRSAVSETREVPRYGQGAPHYACIQAVGFYVREWTNIAGWRFDGPETVPGPDGSRDGRRTRSSQDTAERRARGRGGLESRLGRPELGHDKPKLNRARLPSTAPPS